MMKRLRVRACLLMVLALSALLHAQMPRYRGWVNDYANLIGSSDTRRIEALIQELKDKTGVELAVVTLDNLGGDAIEPYAARLFETWGIGQRETHKGVLFLLAMEERRMRIEVGYGLEGILPDGLVGEIRDRQMLPDFRSGRYGSGFYQGVGAVAAVVAKDAGVALTGAKRTVRRTTPSRGSRRSSGGGLGLLFIIFLVLVTRGRILPWLFIGGMLGGGGRRYDGFGGGGFGGGGFGGGGFGGFGGGMSGGGGASGSF